MTNSCDAIIVGAGPAGLAAAAALKARGRDAIILEKSAAVGSVWRRHYDRLHLHTDRVRSGLPGLAMPIAYGRYPSRLQVVEYLEAYATKFALKPVFNTSVNAIRRDGCQWRAEAGAETFVAPIVVVATGLADFPHSPTWPGMNDFVGPILHSSLYRNPAPFAANGSSSSATAIPAPRSRSTSAKRASTSRSPSAAPSTSFPASSSASRSSSSRSQSNGCRRARPISSTRRRSVWPSARSQRRDSRKRPKGRFSRSRRTVGFRSSTSGRWPRFARAGSESAATLRISPRTASCSDSPGLSPLTWRSLRPDFARTSACCCRRPGAS